MLDLLASELGAVELLVDMERRRPSSAVEHARMDSIFS